MIVFNNGLYSHAFAIHYYLLIHAYCQALYSNQMIFTLMNPYFNVGDEIPKESKPINVTQLATLSRTSIMQHLVATGKLPPQLLECTLLTTNPRNFYLDVLLAKDYELYFDEDQISPEDPGRLKRLVRLPLSLEVVRPDPEWALGCQAESVTLGHFAILRKIGEGTYAEIFLVQRRWDRRVFCMKRINKAECRDKGSLAMINSEYEVLEFPSKYKVKLYYQFEDSRYVYFVIEYCAHGDLYGVIRSNRKAEETNRLTLTEKYLIWMQVAFGVVSLHEKGLVYRDLKPENVLLNENGEVKICDFGFTIKIDPGEKMKELCGSYEYLAPEVIRKEGYNKSVDIYCLGLLFYELLVGSNPYEGVTPETISEMKSKSINFEKKSLSNTVRDLLKKMLKDKPEERLGYESSLQIFRHEFFKQNEDLAMRIINNKVLLRNLRYSEPPKLSEREEVSEKVAYVLSGHGSFNYLKPFFDVTENAGPKLNFTR